MQDMVWVAGDCEFLRAAPLPLAGSEAAKLALEVGMGVREY
jgi:hypothetical protein